MLNHKRIMSLVLAGAMAVSMAVPAFAATTTDDGEGSATNRSLKIDGTYQAVDIAVVVPSSRAITINPYALPVKIGTDAQDAEVKVKGMQIVTQPTAIKNQSDIPLDVNITATATVKGNLTLATTAFTDDTIKSEKKNSAFLYVDVVSSTLTGSEDDVSAAAIASAWKDTTWSTYDESATNIITMTKSGTAVSKNAVATLAYATMEDGAFSAYNAGSVAFVNVTGQCAQAPTTAWTIKDGVTVQLAFTFTPNTDPDNQPSDT
jgi:hypothetical protein